MFSVIIPLYNKAPFVKKTIDSVIGQTFREFEIIVVNDGSTDGGEEIIKNKYGDQVVLIHQANQGVSSARNRGISQAKFDYIAFLDADDILHPDYLKWIVYVLDKYPNIRMVGTSYTNDSLPDSIENPEIELIEDYFANADYNTLFTSSSTVIHRSFFESNIGFKSHLIRGEDIDVWLRTFDWFGKAAYIHASLMHYTLVSSSKKASIPRLDQTILLEIFEPNYSISDRFPSWNSFRDKYLMLNLFQYLGSEVNYRIGQELIGKMRNSFFFAQIPYYMPLSFFQFILLKPILGKFLRNYLKFCFRYIYA
ncbi:glycosyltransferase family A protein [uncultured Algoriphagus sp.]|uniref:glycosyltransferase family A protein n=1 Tax=uncultured Algoriphagus sp. TaxID=417365 RepID=UPI00258918F8|nr:glycosyltransferase family A protein [uncultured Algoriphagus sp.]